MSSTQRLSFPGLPSPGLHLVRHGESTWNAQGLVQGQSDESELTARGRQQAEQVAGVLTGLGAVRLLASDLRRSLQTAEIIGRATGLSPTATSLLREQGLGLLEGMPSADAAVAWERQAEQAAREFGEPLPATAIRVRGGESMRDVLGRAAAVLASPWVTEATGDVILVSHGDTIRIMLAHLLGDDFEDFQWRAVDNGEVHSVYRSASGAVEYTRTPIGGPA